MNDEGIIVDIVGANVRTAISRWRFNPRYHIYIRHMRADEDKRTYGAKRLHKQITTYTSKEN